MTNSNNELKIILSISTEPDLEKVLAKTLGGAINIANAEGGGIALINQQSGDLEVRAQMFCGEKKVNILKAKFNDNLINNVVKTGKSLRLDKSQIELSTGLLVKSILCIPIIFRKKTIGVLYLHNKQTREAFTRGDELKLSNLIKIAANTIHYIILLKDKDRQRDLDIINKIAQELSIKPDPKDVFNEVVHQIASALNCSLCTLYFPKRTIGGEYLIPEASWSKKGVNLQKRKFNIDEGLVGMVYKLSSSNIFSDAARHPNFSSGKVRTKYHHRSMLISPIISGGVTIGLISADQDQLDWFTENDSRLVDALAVHIGIAIERSLTLKAIKTISEMLIGTLNPDHMNYILSMVLETAVQLTTATTGVIYLLDSDKKTILDSKAFPDAEFHPSPRRDEKGNFIGLTKDAIENKKGFVIEDADNNSLVNPSLQKKIKSMAVYPLISQNDVIGVLFIDDESGHKYTQVEVLILETLANQVGIALTSYNLIRRLEKSEEEYKELFSESVQARDGITSKMFYGEISHGVKNVLAAVTANLLLIENNPSTRRLSNAQKNRLEELISDTKKSITNIEEFLDLASESEKATTLVRVDTLVDHALRLLERRIKEFNIIVNTSGINKNIFVKVNRTQMIMAFLNLIDNAIDALKEENHSREINIFTRVSENSNWTEIGFEDNGYGISKEILEKIFTPFFSTKAKKGRGIGLLGTRRIIESHYGKLPRPSSQLGKGTKFMVYLHKP
jgi:signal transduction histidine kinase